MTERPVCPSCHYRLSPLAVECPVCGIPISRPPLKRPLLFQTSKSNGRLKKAPDTTKAPPSAARGYAAAGDSRDNLTSATNSTYISISPSSSDGNALSDDSTKKFQTGADAISDGQSIFWRLVRMEIQEAGVLVLLNGLISLIACWQLGMSVSQVYSVFSTYLLVLHLLASWAYFMLPLVLTGSTVIMLRLDLGIADHQPEKRLSFSLFMLASVILIPFSFLCMVLTPAHTTLAELLTGQEIRERTPDLIRRH